MCKKRIENAAYIAGVKQVNWDKATHELDLVFRNDKVSEEEIIASINNAGHDVKGSLASAEQYEQIHGCCRFEILIYEVNIVLAKHFALKKK